MKKYAFFAAAAAALMTCACSVDPVAIEDVRIEEELTVLSAGFSGAEDDTRTVRQTDGKVFWSPGDEISIIRETNGSHGEKFVSTNTQPSPWANFKGRMPSGNTEYWAVYPYREGNYYNGLQNYLVTYIPTEQEAVAGSYAKDAFISATHVKAGKTSLTFHHMCGGFKFSFTQPDLERVVVHYDQGGGLTGSVALNPLSDGTAMISSSQSAEITSYAVLHAPEGETLATGTDYHLVVRPSSLFGGFTMYFQKKDGTIAVRKVKKNVTVKAGHFLVMEEVDRNLEWKSFFEFFPSSFSVSGDGGVFKMHVHASGGYHVDTSNCDWIQEVKTEGVAFMSQGADVFLSAAPNPGPARTGLVVICSDVTGNCYPVTVSQDSGVSAKVIRHHSLGMCFTATWCRFCPNLDEVLNRTLDRLGDELVTIALYERAGYYSVDSEKILSQYYHLSGYPYAILDGRILLDDMDLDSGPRFIESVVSESGLYYPPATGIAISSTASSRNVTVQVDVFANYEDDYKITAFLVENGIVGYQLVGDTPVNDYRHDHVARMLLTNASLGDSFHASAGETKSFTYTVSVPSDYNFANMEVVAYVQRSFGSRERYQSKDYGEWYVDNSRSAALLTTAPLEVQ